MYNKKGREWLKSFHEIFFFPNKTLEYKALLVEVYMHKSSSICSAFRKQEQEEPQLHTYLGGERERETETAWNRK